MEEYSTMSGITSHDKGSRHEAVVLSKLKRNGCTVSIPWGRPRYDLVVDSGSSLNRAQVKTGNLKNGGVVFECRSGHINSSGNKKIPYTEDEIDCFIVYNPDLDNVYWVDIEEAPKTTMTLRIDDVSKYADEDSVNWHTDYLLSAVV